MGLALTHTLALQGVPDIAVEVVIASKEQASAEGEGHRRDAADDALVGVGNQLLVRPQVEQAAGGIVRARADGLSIGEELRGQGEQGSELGWPVAFPTLFLAPASRCFSRPVCPFPDLGWEAATAQWLIHS